jgi:hypothetical protein
MNSKKKAALESAALQKTDTAHDTRIDPLRGWFLLAKPLLERQAKQKKWARIKAAQRRNHHA